MYAFLDKREDPGVLVFRFEDPDAAPRALDGSGVGTIPSVALFERRMGRPGPFSAAALRYGASPASRRLNPSSSMMGTPSSWAFCSFEPAFSPATR